MSNKNFSNVVSLSQAFDDICDQTLKAVSNLTTIGDYTTTGIYYSPSYPNWDFSWIWSTPNYSFDYSLSLPSYPVSNVGIDSEGTTIIELAVSGFDSKEIEVKREDLKIIVEGKREKKEEEKKVKYFEQHIAKRDFSVSFLGSEKWDFDNLSVSLKNGILRIEIPILESCKPINKTYKITE